MTKDEAQAAKRKARKLAGRDCNACTTHRPIARAMPARTARVRWGDHRVALNALLLFPLMSVYARAGVSTTRVRIGYNFLVLKDGDGVSSGRAFVGLSRKSHAPAFEVRLI